MPAPVINITSGASIVPRSSPTDTGPAHIIGISATGPAGRLLTTDDDVHSLGEWLEVFGGGSLANGRLSYSIDYDWVEKFFLRGGHTLRYSRVIGPAAAKAVLNLAGTGTSLIVTADEYGAFYNQFRVQVTNGTDGTTRIVKLLAADGTTVLDQTAQQASQAAFSGLKLDTGTGKLTITIGGGSGLPTVAAATAMGGTTSGTDDHASVTQTQLDAALTFLPIDLGPGQVAAPNWQTDAMHDSLDVHADANNRFAVPDPVDTTSKSTLISAGSHRQAGALGDRGGLFAPWVQMSPVAGAVTNRSVPPSAVFCAVCATTDADPGGGVAQSPAGPFGIDPTALDVNATFARTPAGASDADALSQAGVNLIIVKNGQVMIYDNLTGVADQTSEFAQIGVARWRMATVALAGSEADGEIFRTVTRQHLQDWKSAVDAILLRQYDVGQLFGDLDDDRPETAFNIDVTTPNTPATINAGEMNMNITARPVKGGRILNISITAVPITQSVA